MATSEPNLTVDLVNNARRHEREVQVPDRQQLSRSYATAVAACRNDAAIA
jgi:hypothetical protein